MGKWGFGGSATRTNLAEDLKLCAIGDDGYSFSPRVVPGLGGALAAELVLAERIEIEFEPESVTVLDATPIGDELVDELLAGLDDPERGPIHLASWIAGVGVGASPHVHSSLVAKGLLETGTARRTRQRIAAVLTGELEPDVRLAVLAGLASACELVEGLVPRVHVPEARVRAAALISGVVIPQRVRHSVEAAQAATASANLSVQLSA